MNNETNEVEVIELTRLEPEGLMTSAQLQYDWIELYLTPVTS